MKVYPSSYKKAEDLEFNILLGVICGALICIFCMISLIVILVVFNEKNDNSLSN